MSYSSKTHPLHTYVHNGGDSNIRKFEYNKKLNDFFPSTIYYPEKLYKTIPKKFEPHKTIWKDLILKPTNQGSCGSCWAYAATNTLSDRYNIWAGKKINNGLSPFLILNCNLFATFFKNEKIVNEIDYETWNKESGCYGNILIASILYIYFFGIPTLDCYPYDIENVNEFNEILNEDLIPVSEDYDTIAGLVINKAGDIPKEGYSFNLNNFKFTVKEVLKKRIKRIEIDKLS